MTALLTLDNASMRYRLHASDAGGDYSVFEGLNFSLNPGERVGLIGANGAGKSTLLKIMAKIFKPVSGRVVWAPGVSASLLSLGLGFRPDFTGRENAMLSCLLQGVSKAQAKQSLAEIKEFCELGHFFDEPIANYSTGMRARLSFATALMNQSKILLIDEVLSVGDQSFRVKARQALSKLSEDRSVVVVSHAEFTIQALCTRVLWLNNGRFEKEGSATEVLTAYADSMGAVR